MIRTMQTGVAVAIALWAAAQTQAVEPQFPVGSVATVGCYRAFNYNNGRTIDNALDRHSFRFTVYEDVTVDRAWQLLLSVDAGTTNRVGIMANDGSGNPSGTFLASAVYTPAVPTDMRWVVFGGSANLTNGGVYHLVTEVVNLPAAGAFDIRCWAGSAANRPYDNARDPKFGILLANNGGAWTVQAGRSPYFVLGSASAPNGVGGPGQPWQTAALDSWIRAYGGLAQANGQRFTISDKEIPATAHLVVTQAMFHVTRNGNVTNNLIIAIRSTNMVVLGRVTFTPAEGDNTDRRKTISPPIELQCGVPYLVTPYWEGGAGMPYSSLTNYSLRALQAQAGQGDATWGGKNACVPIISGSYSDWSTYQVDSSKYNADLYFALIGRVEKPKRGTLVSIR
jgi:hypothetical protein